VRSRFLTFLAASALVAACAPNAGSTARADALRDDAVTVGSFNFGESELLGELYAQALEARGFRVVREFGIGPRELVEPALQTGLVELVPEYAGSLLEFLAGGGASADVAQTREQLRQTLERRGLVALAASAAQDQNGFAVTEQFARELGVGSLSDLAGIDGLVLGGPPECPQRPLCERGLVGAYGITFASFVPLDQSGPLTADALASGTVDVALVFTTSASIVRNRFVLLRDDRQLQPAENVTPVVRADVLERFGPGLATAIDAVSSLLSTDALRALNAEIELHGRPPAEVATEWLSANGLAPGEG
jgi:osmoprotectant transport system substrate-binding protein